MTPFGVQACFPPALPLGLTAGTVGTGPEACYEVACLLLALTGLQLPVSCTVPKAVWKIFKPRNFLSQLGDSAGSLLENFYSATSKE
jgi:hypothetical protein